MVKCNKEKHAKHVNRQLESNCTSAEEGSDGYSPAVWACIGVATVALAGVCTYFVKIPADIVCNKVHWDGEV